jgi:hypothetical protein
MRATTSGIYQIVASGARHPLPLLVGVGVPGLVGERLLFHVKYQFAGARNLSSPFSSYRERPKIGSHHEAAAGQADRCGPSDGEGAIDQKRCSLPYALSGEW